MALPDVLRELQNELQPSLAAEQTRQQSRKKILRRLKSVKSVEDYEATVGTLKHEIESYLMVLKSNPKVR
jgi:hypothetical protein